MRTEKGFWVLLVLLLIVLSAQPVMAASKQGNVYHWNYHTAYDKTYFNGGSHLQSWADRVWEETKHQLKINIFYNAGLGYKGSEVMSSLRGGMLDSAEFSATLYASEAKQPWWLFNDFYHQFDNWEQLKAIDNVAFPMMWKDIENYGGVKPLALFACCPKDAFQGIWMNRKIEKWSDFRGTKIRIFFSMARKYVFDPLGFQTLFLPGPETYQGLKTGLIDGAIQTPAAGLAGKYYEIAKYFYAFQPITSSWWGLLCSQKAFDGLPKDVQDGLVRASKAHEQFLESEVWQDQCKFSPGPGGSPYCERDIVGFFKKQGNVIARVPLLSQKLREQTTIGLKQWIAAEGGPRGQQLMDALEKARQASTKIDVPVFSSLEEWKVTE